MKKEILLLLIVVVFTSCETTNQSQSLYQRYNLEKFSQKKYLGSRTITKRGDHYHPAVTKQTRKTLD